MRISGVPVGKVKTIEPDKETGRSIVVIELRVALRAAALGRAGDPAPEDAAGRDLRRAHAGQRGRRPGAPRAARWRSRRSRRPSSSTRSSARSTPTTRAAFQVWMQEQAKAIGGHGRDVNDALGNLGPFAEDAAELVDILNRQEGAVTRPGLEHRRRVRGADRARRPAALADRELQPRVRGHRGARRASSRRRSSRCRRSSASRA